MVVNAVVDADAQEVLSLYRHADVLSNLESVLEQVLVVMALSAMVMSTPSAL